VIERFGAETLTRHSGSFRHFEQTHPAVFIALTLLLYRLSLPVTMRSDAGTLFLNPPCHGLDLRVVYAVCFFKQRYRYSSTLNNAC